VLGNVKIVLEPAVYTFVYQRFLRVLASVSGHSQGVLVVVKASYLCTNGVLLVVLYYRSYSV
jgi:hypothetical protein